MPLWKSRRFWLLVADAIFTLATYFIGKYAGLGADDWLKIAGVLQPVVIAVIIGLTVEDAARIKASIAERQQ